MSSAESNPTRADVPMLAGLGRFGRKGPRRVSVALTRWGLDESGVTAIEYALIASLIAIAVLAGVGSVGVELGVLYLRVCNAVVGALGGGSC